MSTISAGTISSPGIGSGLDVNSIVSQLMAVEQQPLTALQKQQSTYQSQISAYGQIQSALASFQSAVQALSDPSKFQVFTGTVSNSSVLSVTAGAGASPASYQIETSQLAQQQKLGSGDYASTSDVVGTGSLTIQLGTYDATAGTFTQNGTQPATTITIDSSHNTLAGIRDAINAANAGVSASIINDGSGNRLVLTSSNSGVANSIKITTTDGDGNNTDASGLSALAYDPTATNGAGQNLTQLQAAQNALFKVDGIPIGKPSNTITDAIQGVTLNLAQTNVGQPVSVSVNPDTQTISNTVQGLVSSYNTADKLLRSLSAYNAQTKTASVLTGDSTVSSLEFQMKSILTGGVGSSLSTLSSIGVAFQQDGSLAVDATKLQNALSTNFNGVASLFATNNASTDSQISVAGTTSNTKEGSYSVNITSMATPSQLTGSGTAGLTITAGVNDQLDLMVNGTSASVTIAPGNYASAADLATELQTQINSVLGKSVAVSASAGTLSITTNQYGSNSGISITGGNAAAGLFGASPTSVSGQDVSGTINGQPATGNGQALTANAGSLAEGISVLVSGGATGPRGSVTYTQGIAARLNQYLTGALGDTGSLASRTTGLNTSIQQITNQENDLQTQLALIQQRYLAQFTALDTMLSSMSQTSTFLTQQLAAINNLTPSSTGK
ncbi:MAG: flagellar filament capping protein FliD [Thiobacillaceae bacterium]